jgi:hypothetical protein
MKNRRQKILRPRKKSARFRHGARERSHDDDEEEAARLRKGPEPGRLKRSDVGGNMRKRAKAI